MNEPNDLMFRHEYKHTINLLDYYTLRSRLKNIMQSDPNAGNNGKYHIRSLYFDNDDDKALREKLYGVSNREKYRIRLYNGNSSFIRLEKKSKQSGLCSKQSVVLSHTQAEKILNSDTAWMKVSPEPLLIEFYGKMLYQRLKPKTIVDYNREAYIYPFGNVRITFDTDIRTGLYSSDLFNYDTPTISVNSQGIVLLEVKYDSFLPSVIYDIIQTKTRRTEAFSKYAVCRIYG